MKKNTTNLEDALKRAQILAGIKPINESKGTPSTILMDVVGHDLVKYAIVKEEGSYYIKSTINENDFDYIGGIKNKHNYKYKYDSYAHATRNLNYLIIDLKEAYDKTSPVIFERLEKDITPEGGPSAPMPGEGGTLPQEPAIPSTPAPSAPAPEMAAPSAPVTPDTPVDDVIDATAPDVPVDDAPEGGGDEGLSSDDSDLEEPAEGGSIDHFVGKLTAEIRNAGEDMNPDKMKSILNSIISALPLNMMPAEERLVIARRVKRGGQKEGDKESVKKEMPSVENSPEMSEPPIEEKITIPMDEIITPLEKPTSQFKTPHDFNKEDDVKINEFFANIKDGDFVSENNVFKYKNMLFEAKENKLILNKGDNKFTYSISENTMSKFKQLLK